ncbi:hypothetical protein [Streptomyces sp. NPDC003522]
MAVTDGRRLWRWVVAVWLVLVAVAGGLTLWWQDPEEAQRPAWEKSGPTPSLPEGWETACAHVTPDEDGGVACFIKTR